MPLSYVRLLSALIILWAPSLASAPAVANARAPRSSFRLDSLAGLELAGLEQAGVHAEVATYRGRKAVRLVDRPVVRTEQAEQPEPYDYPLATVADSEIGDGTIEVEIAGAPRAGASATARGFIGIAFRVQPRASHFECFYLRPTNARAEDQLRRNHSTQYISFPGFPWERLRREQPGVYESYVDLEPGVWTRLKIVVSGTQARLYLHGAEQPALIVKDLKQGESRGKIGLWIGDETDGYFSNLSVEPAPKPAQRSPGPGRGRR
jgi:hypothetical protein